MNEQQIRDRITLTFNEKLPGDFSLLLQRGVLFPAEIGSKVKPLLTEVLRVSEEYVDNRINTVFLNGKAVDDLDTATVGPDAVIAVSASMPGFVGACFRKGGYYATMRSNVAHAETGVDNQGRRTMVSVKLLNMLAVELGEALLAEGIAVPAGDFRDFCSRREEAFRAGLASVVANGTALDVNSVLDGKWPEHDELIELKAVV